MHVHFLDPYRPKSSLIHRLDPRVKLTLALAFILTTTLVPAGLWPIFVLLLSLVLCMEILSELAVLYVLKRSTLAFPFLLAAFPLLFTVEGAPLTTFSIGSLTLTISDAGLTRFASIAIKSWISVQAAIVLTATTPFPDLLLAMRALRVPRLLVAIFGLMWRYMFVLVDEAMRLIRARAARSGVSDAAKQSNAKPGGSLTWRARVTGGMAGNLFVRSLDRGDSIYSAMVARGYDGEIRAFPLPRIAASQWAVLVSGLALLLALLGLSYLLWV